MCPVMASHVMRIYIHAGLPLSRDTCASAKRDEKKCLNTAVTLKSETAIIGNFSYSEILSHKRISDLCGAVIVKSSRQKYRIFLITADFFAKSLDKRSKSDMRIKLLCLKRRLFCLPGKLNILLILEVDIIYNTVVLIFNLERLIFIKLCLKENCSLSSFSSPITALSECDKILMFFMFIAFLGSGK